MLLWQVRLLSHCSLEANVESACDASIFLGWFWVRRYLMSVRQVRVCSSCREWHGSTRLWAAAETFSRILESWRTEAYLWASLLQTLTQSRSLRSHPILWQALSPLFSVRHEAKFVTWLPQVQLHAQSFAQGVNSNSSWSCWKTRHLHKSRHASHRCFWPNTEIHRSRLTTWDEGGRTQPSTKRGKLWWKP